MSQPAVKQITPDNFLSKWSLRNKFLGLGLSSTCFFRAEGMEAMNLQFPSWRSQNGQTLWLSGLIGAMEWLSRPEWRTGPIDPVELGAVQAHLALPAMGRSNRWASCSLRN